MRTNRYLLIAGIFGLLLGACASRPENPPLASYDPTMGYRLSLLKPDHNTDRLFVILAFSGPGQRAAALSYGVLAALRDTQIRWNGQTTNLLDEVDVISATSWGGSMVAAYYGLYRHRIFETFEAELLYRPVIEDLTRLFSRPSNWFRLASPTYSFGDLVAEYYDENVFNGATYAEIIANERRPFVVLNATDMSIGAQFSFTQDQFDMVCSDLSGLTIGQAVAASSAIGLNPPITLKNYAGTCEYRHPGWVDNALKDRESRRDPRRTAHAEANLSSLSPETCHGAFVQFTIRAEFIGVYGVACCKASRKRDQVRKDPTPNGCRHGGWSKFEKE